MAALFPHVSKAGSLSFGNIELVSLHAKTSTCCEKLSLAPWTRRRDSQVCQLCHQPPPSTKCQPPPSTCHLGSQASCTLELPLLMPPKGWATLCPWSPCRISMMPRAICHFMPSPPEAHTSLLGDGYLDFQDRSPNSQLLCERFQGKASPFKTQRHDAECLEHP